jgi:hypothetical protein
MSALVALGCKKSTPEPSADKQPAASSAQAAKPDAKALAELEAKTKPAPPPVEESGTWVDSDKYELKLVRTEQCKESGKAGGEAGPKDAKTRGTEPTTTPEGMLLLGVRIQVKAKLNEFFVAPKHATLYDGDLRFEAKMGEEFAKCTPSLKPVMLKRGDVATGFVVFELPAKHKKLVLNYGPVRWGGARSLRVAVPEPDDAQQARPARATRTARK